MENQEPLNPEIVTKKELEKIKLEVDSFLTQARVLAAAVKDEASKLQAEEYAVNLKSEIRRREAFYKPMKQAAKATHEAICRSEHDVIDGLKDADSIISQSCAAYTALVERQHREDQERLTKEAKIDQEDHALRTAEHLEASGQKDAADAILDGTVAFSTPPVILPKQSTAKGVTYRDVYVFRVLDLGALIKAAGTRLELRPLLAADTTAIRRRVESLKGMADIPGVEIRVQKAMTVRSQKIA